MRQKASNLARLTINVDNGEQLFKADMNLFTTPASIYDFGKHIVNTVSVALI